MMKRKNATLTATAHLFVAIGILTAANTLHADYDIDGLWLCNDPAMEKFESLMSQEAWKNNMLGVNHIVPEPWENIRANDLTVKYWGRETQFNGAALPVQIVNQNQPMLIEPISIKVQFAGEADLVNLTQGKGAFSSKFDDIAIWEGSINDRGIDIKTKVETEFDGFTVVSITYKSEKKIKRLCLDIPMAREMAKYFQRNIDCGFDPELVLSTFGKLNKNIKSKSMLAIGNEHIGLNAFTESFSGFYNKRRDRRFECVLDNDSARIRFNFVDLIVPEALDKPRTMEVFFNAFPYRPIQKDFRNYIVNTSWRDLPGKVSYPYSWENKLKNSRCFSCYQGAGMQLSIEAAKQNESGHPYFPIGALPIPYDTKRTLENIRYHHDQRVSYAPYTVGNLRVPRGPEDLKYGNEWNGGKFKDETALKKLHYDALNCPKTALWGETPVCGHAKSWIDYKVFVIMYWAKALDLDGIYMDNPSFVDCINESHKNHQFVDENGNHIEVNKIRNYREMAKRIYREFKAWKGNKTGIVGHTFPAYAPFMDVCTSLEHIQSVGKTKLITDIFSIEDCKAFYCHYDAYGILMAPLHPNGTAGSDTIKNFAQADRAFLTFCWLTDTAPIYGKTSVVRKNEELRDRLNLSEVSYTPFWENNTAVYAGGNSNVGVQLYKKLKTNEAVIVVCNYGKEDMIDKNLTIKMNDLFIAKANKYIVKDAESGAQIEYKIASVEENTILQAVITVPNQNFRVITISE